MRYFFPCLLATGLIASLSACAGEQAATQKEKAAALSSRQEVTLRLARATEAGGDSEGAEKMYVQVVTQSPASPVPLLELAQFYRRHREDSKAVQTLQNGLKYMPGNADVARELANTYIGLGEPEKALAVLEPVIAANKNNALLYNSQGVALDQIGSYAAAQKSYRQANEIDPGNGMMYKVNTSMSYILSGSYDKAIALLRPILDAPDAPPIVRQNLALAYGLKGESETALKLGLQDLSDSEAAENLKFYRMLAQKHAATSGPKTSSAPVPASVVRQLFPESEEDAVAASPAAEAPTSRVSMVAPVTILPAVATPAPAAAPVKVAAAKITPVTPDEESKDDDDDDAPVAAKPAESAPVQKQAVSAPAVPTVPVRTVAASAAPVAPDEDDKDDDDGAPVADAVKLGPVKATAPITTLSPSSGYAEDTASASAVMVVSPDESSLPQPILKPDRE